MKITDVLVGVGIAWLSLTPEGQAVRDRFMKQLAETYLIPKDKKEVKENDNAQTQRIYANGQR